MLSTWLGTWLPGTAATPAAPVDDAGSLIAPLGWTPPAFDGKTQVRIVVNFDSPGNGKLTLYDTQARPRRTNTVSSSTTATSVTSATTATTATMTTVDTVAPAAHGAPSASSVSSSSSSSAAAAPPTPSRSRSGTTARKTVPGELSLLSEMMFGAVPLNVQGTTTKVHLLAAPAQVLLTKLFTINPNEFSLGSNGRYRSGSGSANATPGGRATGSPSAGRTPGSIPGQALGSPPGTQPPSPVGMFGGFPWAAARSRAQTLSPNSALDSAPPSLSSTREPNSLRAIQSFETRRDRSHTTFQPPEDDPTGAALSMPTGVSASSYTNRRYHRHMQTTFENGSLRPSSILGGPASPGTPSRADGDYAKRQQRRMQFGVGVVVLVENNTALQELLFSHFALVEGHLHALQKAVADVLQELLRDTAQRPDVTTSTLQSYLTPYILQSHEAVFESATTFQRRLQLLFQTPRIHEPLWLSLVSFPQRRAYLCRQLVNELCYLVDNYDTRKTNFFISTVLTAVLANHLAWVATVAPEPLGGARPPASPSTTAHNGDGDGDGGGAGAGAPTTFQAQFPYNPLWAQLTDLYGAIATPSEMARTVVTGRNIAVVHRLLYVLTYFIRCSEVVENVEHWTGPDTHAHTAHGATTTTYAHGMVVEEPYRSRGSTLDEAAYRAAGMLAPDEPATPPPSTSVSQHTPARISPPRARVSAVAGVSDADFNALREVDLPPLVAVATVPATAEVQPSGHLSLRPESLFSRTYGRSLFAGRCSQYVPDFVLLGVAQTNFVTDLVADIKSAAVLNVLDEPVRRASAIVINTDDWRCEQLSGSLEQLNGNQGQTPRLDGGVDSVWAEDVVVVERTWAASDYIVQTVSVLRGLLDLGVPPESCVMRIEDRLQELYFKSLLLSRIVNSKPDELWSYRAAASVIAMPVSDLPLLVAVASVHTSGIAKRFTVPAAQAYVPPRAREVVQS